MSNRQLSPAVEVVSEPREPEHIKVLREAKARINKPEKWCKGAYVSFRDPSAYCMLGSMGWRRSAVNDAPLSPGTDDASWLLKRVIGENIPDFNDAGITTHADVMAAFDLAIEQATRDWLVAK